MTGMDRLTDGQRRALYFAVAAVMTGMAIGFLSSFLTLYGAAQLHGWRFPWRLPLAVDFGILAYVVLDHLAVTLGSRSRWLHVAAWALAAFTVWANAAVTTKGGTVWRVIDAAMPALWVLGVEALRFTWRKLHEDGTQPDRIPAGRYLAAPVATARMRRRMWLTAETSYPRAAAIEDARLHAADLIRAATESDPGLSVPASLRRAVRSGRLPASVIAAVDTGLRFGGASEWEPEVASWITSQLTLPERLAARLRNERQSIARTAPQPALEAAPEAVPQDVPQTVSRPSRGSSPKRPAKPSPSAVKRMSGSDLAPYVGTLLETTPGLTAADVMRALKVGREKAVEALRLARKERLHVAAEG